MKRFSRPGVLLLALSPALALVAAPVGLAQGAQGAERSWQSYVLGSSAPQVFPVDVTPRGNVSDPEKLVRDRGATVLTTVAGQTPASVLLDFGKDVAGTPFVDVAAVSGSPTLSLVTGEARTFVRTPAATTLTAAAAEGATSVRLASVANVEVGNRITFGSAADEQIRVLTAVDTESSTVTFSRGLTAAVAEGAVVTSAPGAPSSDEIPFLAGSGGIDTLRPTEPGRVDAAFHGGFRFVLITLTSPGSISLSDVGVKFQAHRAGPNDYEGWFLSSDDQLNKMWYSGAYTLQLNMKPEGVNGLPDRRLYDGAKRDRSIWTGDLLVQGPGSVLTLGDEGAAYLKSSLDVMLTRQRADGALPSSPDFIKSQNPQGSPFFYSNNYSGYGARAVIDYYRYTGDRAYVTAALPKLRRELAYNASFVDADNLVVSNDRDYWQSFQNGQVTKYSIDYYVLLREMAWLERQVGTATQAAAYDTEANEVKAAVNAKLWNPELGAYGQSSENPDVLVEDANALALAYGIAPADRRASILAALQTLWTPFGALIGPGLEDPTGHTIEPLGNGMETAGRFAVNDTRSAIELMRRTWGPMVDKSNPLYTGAFWEFKNSEGGVNRNTASLAHGWAAAPTVQLTELVLGITPVNPGYATWSIKPRPGSLTWARGAVPTPRGDITAAWSADPRNASLRLRTEAPPSTRGTIAIPANRNSVVTVNGRTAWHTGKSLAYGATLADGYVTLTMPGGTYEVAVSDR